MPHRGRLQGPTPFGLRTLGLEGRPLPVWAWLGEGGMSFTVRVGSTYLIPLFSPDPSSTHERHGSKRHVCRVGSSVDHLIAQIPSRINHEARHLSESKVVNMNMDLFQRYMGGTCFNMNMVVVHGIGSKSKTTLLQPQIKDRQFSDSGCLLSGSCALREFTDRIGRKPLGVGTTHFHWEFSESSCCFCECNETHPQRNTRKNTLV